MQTTTPLQNEVPKPVFTTGGQTTNNPLQLEKNTQNPLQLKKPVNNPLQLQAGETATPGPNNTGLPDNLKTGVEALSGYSMDDVKVHYNSDKPAELQALAYAQGTDIHVAPGQEQHLPHEAWHVVQQKQGRVQPTMQMKEGVAVNHDKELEKEADIMGGNALQMKENLHPQSSNLKLNSFSSNAAQRMPGKRKGKEGKVKEVVVEEEVEEEGKGEDATCVDILRSALKDENFVVKDLVLGKEDFFIWGAGIGDKDSDHIHVFFKQVPQAEKDYHLVKPNNMTYTVTCKGANGRAIHLRVDEPKLDSSLIKIKMDAGKFSERVSQRDLLCWGVGDLQAVDAKLKPRTFNNIPAYVVFAKWVDDLKNILESF